MSEVIYLKDEAATISFAKEFAKGLPRRLILFLEGSLGAGKTTFCRALIQALGYEGTVKSPTYTLVEPYHTETAQVYHFDFYRLVDPEELEYMGLWDYLSQEAICLIEWPERGQSVLPKADLVLHFRIKGEGREVTVEANTPQGEQLTIP